MGRSFMSFMSETRNPNGHLPYSPAEPRNAGFHPPFPCLSAVFGGDKQLIRPLGRKPRWSFGVSPIYTPEGPSLIRPV